MNKTKVAIMFGGVSAEHDVSVITGLQVFEAIDKERFEPYMVLLSQESEFLYYPGYSRRRDFKGIKSQKVIFACDESGVFFKINSPLGKKIYLDAAYLAFHGGNGESGQVQGLLETLKLPFTSPSSEASAIAMNKVLSKECLEKYEITSLPWSRFFSVDIQKNVGECAKLALKHLSLPVIIKPAHLGSSIGINVARTEVELKKYLNEASFIDSEVLVEKYIVGFKEYNCSIRLVDGNLEASEIEEPVSHDEILSFADKYQRGGNKKGGMAALTRKLPAPISEKLKADIQYLAKRVFTVCRCSGMIRVDFMYYKNKLYVTEVNPIPGSMAFFLWEASGITFKQQITDMLNQAIKDQDSRNAKKIVYSSDIVEKFVSQKPLNNTNQ